jgi:serine/threonine protein kinase
MNAETGTPGWPPPRSGGEHAIREWLDALAAGRCSPDEFFVEMRERFDGDSNRSWEALSLLDQYYRRGKIRADVFRAVKSRLEGSAIGADSARGADFPRGNESAPDALDLTRGTEEDAVPTLRLPPSKTVTAPVVAAVTDRPRATPNPANVSDQPRAVADPPRPISNSPKVSDLPKAGLKQPKVSAQPKAVPDKPRAAPRSAARDVKVGDVLRDRYRVQAEIGRGGMGTVFAALDEYRLALPASGQQVAIKVLHTEVTQRDELLAELQREFQHLQSLSHPNIVRVHEFDRDGEVAFFTMELLSGALLSRTLIARNFASLPRPYAWAIIRDVGAALAHAHAAGVVHGDVNPQNIYITNDGTVRVLDFGASKRLPAANDIAVEEIRDYAPLATPGFASCQSLEGQPVDARDDIFALACVAYLLLSGEHPFPQLTAIQARAQNIKPARPRGLTGPQWRALRGGLNWERDGRPDTVQNWLDAMDLRAAVPHLPGLPALVAAPRPPRRGKLLPAAAAVAFLLLAAVGVWIVMDFDSPAEAVTSLKSQALVALTSAGTFISQLTESAPSRGAPTTKPTQSTENPTATAPSAYQPAQTPNMRASAAAPATPAPAILASAAPAPTSAPPNRASANAPAAASSASVRNPITAGPARIEMAVDTVDVPASEGTAMVNVRRKGSTRGEANFTWWTESGTAKPGVDFVPATPHVEHFAVGSNSVNVSIKVSSQPHSQPKSFYVVIDQADSGPPLGARNLTLVTLLPPE